MLPLSREKRRSSKWEIVHRFNDASNSVMFGDGCERERVKGREELTSCEVMMLK
jgi:hypothetical protein